MKNLLIQLQGKSLMQFFGYLSGKIPANSVTNQMALQAKMFYEKLEAGKVDVNSLNVTLEGFVQGTYTQVNALTIVANVLGTINDAKANNTYCTIKADYLKEE